MKPKKKNFLKSNQEAMIWRQLFLDKFIFLEQNHFWVQIYHHHHPQDLKKIPKKNFQINHQIRQSVIFSSSSFFSVKKNSWISKFVV